MTIKKICTIVFLVLFLAAAALLAFHYCHTSKQVYEGVLIYQELQVKDTVCAHS